MDVVKVLLCHADGAQTPVSVEDLAQTIEDGINDVSECPVTLGYLEILLRECA